MAETWVTRWKVEVAPTPVLPGIWRLRGGGFVACAQVRDPKSRPEKGERPKYKTAFRVMRDAATAKEAFDWLTGERERIRLDDPLLLEIVPWKDFAVSHLERRVQAGDLHSAATVDTWKRILEKIIQTAAWASLPVNEVRHAYIQDWRDMLPTLTWKIERNVRGEIRVISSGRYGPRTLNSWLAIASIMWKAATARYELPRNPMDGIKKFSVRVARTYSVEQPNALNPWTQIGEFLARLKASYPRWYAFTLMGFVLGQRPSSLRPLRRRGPNADIDLVKRKVYIRRSHTAHGRRPGEDDLIMDTTKTGHDLELSIPDELVEVLKWHIAMIDESPIGKKTDLLFPSPFTGRLLSQKCLETPWKNVLKEMGLERLNLTARAMRRTYQDLADAAHLRGMTAMAVSGHKTVGMKLHYSTTHEDEMREGIAKVYDLATRRKAASGSEKS